jgi:hypothetical protein
MRGLLPARESLRRSCRSVWKADWTANERAGSKGALGPVVALELELPDVAGLELDADRMAVWIPWTSA